MKKILKSIQTFLLSRKLLALGAVLMLVLLLIPETGLAQTSPGDPVTDVSKQLSKLYNDVITVLATFMQFFQRMLWPLLLLIGGLLKNDILFSAGMEETMLAIWVNVRNLVNILFVLVLLGIAFYNVIGGESQDYHIKTVLPRFVIALIAVNFSFLGIKVVIDGVNVVTTAIFALPTAVERDLKGDDANLAAQFCPGIYGRDKKVFAESVRRSRSDDDVRTYCTESTNPYTFTDEGKRYFASFDSHNAAIAMAINLADIGDLDVLKVPNASLENLAVNQIFSIVLYAVYTAAFITLFIILMVRLVVIWVSMVLSPLIVLRFVLPESIKSSMGGGDLTQKFIQTIIVPIPVALVMSIGFIMLQAFKDAKLGDTAADTLTEPTLNITLLTSGLSTLQEVVAAVGMVVFIWVGVFAASKNTFAESITETIKSAGEGLGKFVAAAPVKYLPLIPVGEGKEKFALGEVAAAATQYPRRKEMESQKKVDRIIDIVRGGVGANLLRDRLSKLKSPTAKDITKAMADAGMNSHRDTANQTFIHRAMQTSPEQRTILNNLKGKLQLKDGTPVTPDEFMKKLQDGKAEEELMDQFRRELERMHPDEAIPTPPAGTTPPGAAPPPGQAPPGTAPPPGAAPAAAAGATMAVAAADGIISDGRYNAYSLAMTDDQKAKAEAFRDDSAKLADAEDGLKVTDAARANAGDFIGKATTAVNKGDENELDAALQARHGELVGIITKNDPSISDPESRADQIISAELENNVSIPDNLKTDTVKRIEKAGEDNPGLNTPPPKPKREPKPIPKPNVRAARRKPKPGETEDNPRQGEGQETEE